MSNENFSEKSPGNCSRIFTLPLFPLQMVLFPPFPLQLHIFEERYKAMINGCIERNTPFGVVLIREGSEVGAPAVPFEVGCVARILGVEKFNDGRMNLLAAGEGRFRLLEYMEADLPYLVGWVEEIEDAEDADEEVSCLSMELNELFRRYLDLLAERAELPMPDVELPEDPTLLTFCIASVAMLPVLDKQHLLEMTNRRERLETELLWLRQKVDELEQEPEVVKEHSMISTFESPIDIDEEPWLQFREEYRN